MAAIKGQSITVQFLAWDTSNNVYKTGDSANFTLRIVKDGGTPAAPTNSPSEVDATNQPGVYELTLTAAEMNADIVSVRGKSSTANIIIIGTQIATLDLNDLNTNVIEGTIDDIQLKRLMLSWIAGASTRSGSTVTLLSQDGTINRLVYTMDNDGQRSTVVVNGTTST